MAGTKALTLLCFVALVLTSVCDSYSPTSAASSRSRHATGPARNARTASTHTAPTASAARCAAFSSTITSGRRNSERFCFSQPGQSAGIGFRAFTSCLVLDSRYLFSPRCRLDDQYDLMIGRRGDSVARAKQSNRQKVRARRHAAPQLQAPLLYPPADADAVTVTNADLLRCARAHIITMRSIDALWLAPGWRCPSS